MFNLNINGTIKNLVEKSDRIYRYFLEWHGYDNDASYQGYITFDSDVDLGNTEWSLLDVVYNLIYMGYYGGGQNKVCTIPFTIKFIGEGGTTIYTVHAWKITNTVWTTGSEGMYIQPVAVYYVTDNNTDVEAVPSSVPSLWIPLHGNSYDTDDASFKYCSIYPERNYPDD